MGLTRPCCLPSSSTFSSLISTSLFSFPNSSISSTTPFCVWQVLVYLWNAELSLISEYLRWKNYERSLQNYDLPVWKRFRKISLFLPRKTSLWIKHSLQDTFPVLQDDYPVHHLQEAGVVGRHDPGGSWVEDANVVKNLVALERSPFGPIRWWKRWLATYSHNSISIKISVLRQSSWDLSVNSTQRTIKQNKLKKVKIAKGEFFIVAKINLWFWESSSGKCHSLFLTSRKVHLEMERRSMSTNMQKWYGWYMEFYPMIWYVWYGNASPPALQSESCLQLAEDRGREKMQNIPTPELWLCGNKIFQDLESI